MWGKVWSPKYVLSKSYYMTKRYWGENLIIWALFAIEFKTFLDLESHVLLSNRWKVVLSTKFLDIFDFIEGCCNTFSQWNDLRVQHLDMLTSSNKSIHVGTESFESMILQMIGSIMKHIEYASRNKNTFHNPKKVVFNLWKVFRQKYEPSLFFKDAYRIFFSLSSFLRVNWLKGYYENEEKEVLKKE